RRTMTDGARHGAPAGTKDRSSGRGCARPARARAGLVGAVGASAVVALAACDSGSTGPPLHEIPVDVSLPVTTHTTGEPLDRDTLYRVTIDTLVDVFVGPDTTVTLTVRGGVRDVELLDVQENCTVADDNPRPVAISIFNENDPVVFDVDCAPHVGSVRVVVATTGSTPDPDGYRVTLDGADTTAVAVNGEVAWAGVRVGDHAVELSGLEAGCGTTDNPRTVTVAFTQESEVRFDVVCEPPPPA
ncbi:MAG TPA: hypothetical protein VK849_01630, partial [Longimicrobiales bacterium]|nr:hypothetical protein [Longimicrobiales bacterium]